MDKIGNFDGKCYRRRKQSSPLGALWCSRKLSPEFTYKIRMGYFEAEAEWQDMKMIGHREANRCTVQTTAVALHPSLYCSKFNHQHAEQNGENKFILLNNLAECI